MHWRRTRRARERAQEDLLTRLLLNQAQLCSQLEETRLRLEEALLQQATRELLLSALRPMAAAMLRQDSLREAQQQEIRELLLEVLTSLQPSAEEQIFPRI